MWRWIKGWLRKSPPKPVNVAELLDSRTLSHVLKDARFLHSQGVSVRDLYPGEVPPDEPELGDQPM